MTETLSEIVAMLAFLGGLYVASLFHLQNRSWASAMVARPSAQRIHSWWFADWGFDWLYDTLLVRPFLWLAETNKADFIDTFYTGIARLTEAMYRTLQLTQTGVLRWYAAGLALGSAVFLAFVVWP
jgi:NADH-quinone oxidoreductase subunit L